MTPDTTALMGLLRTVLERLDSIDSRLNGTEYQMPRLLTPKDVERRFGISERQQYNLRKDGTLPYIRKTPGGPIHYLTPDVLGYILGEDTHGCVAAGKQQETVHTAT